MRAVLIVNNELLRTAVNIQIAMKTIASLTIKKKCPVWAIQVYTHVFIGDPHVRCGESMARRL